MKKEVFFDRKFILRFFLISLVPFIWNGIFASVVSYSLNNLLYDKKEFEIFVQSLFVDPKLSWINMTSFILSFFIPSFFITKFLYPIYKAYFIKKILDENQVIDRFLSYPKFSSIISSLGWGIGTVGFFFLVYYSEMEISSATLIKGTIVNVLLCLLVLSTVYFTMDLFSRKFIIPELFDEKSIAGLPSNYSRNLLHQFLFYFLTICIIPILLYFGILFNLKKDKMGYLIFITGIFISVGFLLTRYILTTISKPISKIQTALNEIRNGNLDIKVNLISNDELGFLASSLNLMTEELKEKEFIKNSFGKIIDPRVRDLLLKGEIKLGGDEKEVSVLFVDIRGFTSISEKLEPNKLVEWLNLYFENLGSCILENNGIINKFIGDSIMAIFGSPIPLENPSNSAILAAIKMRTETKKLNEYFKQNSMPELKIGIGIHTGKVILGNIGMKDRVEYTAIGDTVNIASRIESLCKEFQTDILFSENSMKLSGVENSKFISETNIRGKENQIKLYSI